MPEQNNQSECSNGTETQAATGTVKPKKKSACAKIIVYALILLVCVFVGVFSSYLPFLKITKVLQLKTGTYESHYVYFGFIGGGTRETESNFRHLTDGSTDKAVRISTERRFFFGRSETESTTLGYYVDQFERLWDYEETDYKPQLTDQKKVIIRAFAEGNEITINRLSSEFTQDALGIRDDD